MPRVLVVTSMFLPYLAADTHRARLLATELPRVGWEVEILVPGDEFQLPGHQEPHAELLAVNAPVHRVSPEWSSLFRLLNSRTLGWRAYRPLRREGDALLSRKDFDLVFFSCSQSALFYLGHGWRQRFGVPFVIDLHDPWYTPLLRGASHLPGWKRRVSNYLAYFLERATVRQAAGLVSVSPMYLETLNQRYWGCDWPALLPGRQAAIPFGACERDYWAADQLPQSDFKVSQPGIHTIVYTGAGGPIMEESFRALCRQLAVARKRAPALFSGLQIQLFGTEPLVGERAPVLSRVAAEEGLESLIYEHPARLSYLEALRRVSDADGLLIFGVNDPAYAPSKLFLYALSGKPILACLRSGSVVDRHFVESPDLGWLIHFEPGSRGAHAAEVESLLAYLHAVGQRRVVDRRLTLDPWMAPAMAHRLAAFFDSCLEPTP